MRTRPIRPGSRGPRPLVVLRGVGQLALAVMAVVATALLIAPRVLGWQGVVVLTGSMEPKLDAGGVAFVDRVPADRIGVGDVMTFTRSGSRQQLTHRVTAVTHMADGPHFRTRGDANPVGDPWVVTPRQVVGKVRFALPRLGGLAQLLVHDRQLLALYMAIPAAFLLTDEFRRTRLERRVLERWREEDRVRVPVHDEPLPPIRPARPVRAPRRDRPLAPQALRTS